MIHDSYGFLPSEATFHQLISHKSSDFGEGANAIQKTFNVKLRFHSNFPPVWLLGAGIAKREDRTV